jgi:2-amino-4-hydroxy-6-hydroxymethyldihydropteridine diphosphokinase
MRVPARVVLSVGSNLGDRLGTLQRCVQAIGRLPDTDVVAISPVYQTAPVGGPPQPDYLNAVLIVATGLPPRDLLAAAHRIEAARYRHHQLRQRGQQRPGADPAASARARAGVRPAAVARR